MASLYDLAKAKDLQGIYELHKNQKNLIGVNATRCDEMFEIIMSKEKKYGIDLTASSLFSVCGFLASFYFYVILSVIVGLIIDRKVGIAYLIGSLIGTYRANTNNKKQLGADSLVSNSKVGIFIGGFLLLGLVYGIGRFVTIHELVYFSLMGAVVMMITTSRSIHEVYNLVIKKSKESFETFKILYLNGILDNAIYLEHQDNRNINNGSLEKELPF